MWKSNPVFHIQCGNSDKLTTFEATPATALCLLVNSCTRQRYRTNIHCPETILPTIKKNFRQIFSETSVNCRHMVICKVIGSYHFTKGARRKPLYVPQCMYSYHEHSKQSNDETSDKMKTYFIHKASTLQDIIQYDFINIQVPFPVTSWPKWASNQRKFTLNEPLQIIIIKDTRVHSKSQIINCPLIPNQSKT